LYSLRQINPLVFFDYKNSQESKFHISFKNLDEVKIIASLLKNLVYIAGS